MFNEYSPLFYSLGQYKVPAVYLETSDNYEGYHSPFWISIAEFKNSEDVKIRTANYRN